MTEPAISPLAAYTLSHLPGWCSPEKREATAKIIADIKPSLVVELGTFGGSWLLPSALALPLPFWCDGIDPYDAGACTEGMTTQQNIDWWGNKTMLEDVYQNLMQMIEQLDLRNVIIHRARSEDRAVHFVDGCIDLLHIDGNHSAVPAMRDATLYLPKVRVGGVIICDDEDWTESGIYTIRPMIQWLLGNGCEYLYSVTGAAFLRKIR